MKTWLALHYRAARDAALRLGESPLNTLLTLMVVAIALLLPAAGKVFLDNIARLGQSLSSPHQLTLFLDRTADARARSQIEEKLRAQGVADIEFVSKEQALKKLVEESGLTNIMGGLDGNPLPDALIVNFGKAASKGENVTAHLADVTKSAQDWPHVAHVQSDSQWAQKLDALLRLGTLAVSLLAAVLATGLVAVVFNTIRLQVMARAAEIEVALMIGATTAYIRRPFVWLGALQGFSGALLALGLLHMALSALQGPANELSGLYGGQFVLKGFEAGHAALLVLFSTTLGWASARLSVALSLRKIEP